MLLPGHPREPVGKISVVTALRAFRCAAVSQVLHPKLATTRGGGRNYVRLPSPERAVPFFPARFRPARVQSTDGIRAGALRNDATSGPTRSVCGR